ncbi:hypothetical protein SY83_04610 [Paenibacillus swuensis]|uniref:Uncharacterized protein n=1 Tax=Paenibacillus swuensis TaxID=1178515 RepID=A0A172TFB2_9BACL|nr:hypothetical protein [Paenibacillus swuensis]ANE45700.1 hypothetical protein SY83_04610 [Paenibacillus swuensis]
MDILLYLIFGFLDLFAVTAIMFSLFRFQLREYVKEIVFICGVLSVVSYVNRAILGIPEYDLAIQFGIYVLFMRYVIRIRLFKSILLSAFGFMSYLLIQFIIFPLLVRTGFVSLLDAQSLHNLGTYGIQFSTDVVSFGLVWFAYRFRLGFSSVEHPPHNFSQKEQIKGSDLYIAYVVIMGVLSLCTVVYWLLNSSMYLYFILPSLTLTLAALVHLTYRKEFDI